MSVITSASRRKAARKTPYFADLPEHNLARQFQEDFPEYKVTGSLVYRSYEGDDDEFTIVTPHGAFFSNHDFSGEDVSPEDERFGRTYTQFASEVVSLDAKYQMFPKAPEEFLSELMEAFSATHKTMHYSKQGRTHRIYDEEINSYLSVDVDVDYLVENDIQAHHDMDVAVARLHGVLTKDFAAEKRRQKGTFVSRILDWL